MHPLVEAISKLRTIKCEAVLRRLTVPAVMLAVLSLAASPAYALGRPLGPAGPTSSLAASQAQQAAKLKLLQTRANAEIERRILRLNSLTALITNSKKLTSADQASLMAEINGEINGDSTFIGLKNLQAKIDSDTDLTVALQDKQTIVTEYRVFVFIVPQVHIVSVADQQQTIEGKLSTFAGKLQTRITAAQNQGKDVASLQTQLTAMNQEISSATSLSSSTEQKVLALRPADYDGNTTILKQYRQNLQMAHQDDQSAVNDAKQIIQGLEKL